MAAMKLRIAARAGALTLLLAGCQAISPEPPPQAQASPAPAAAGPPAQVTEREPSRHEGYYYPPIGSREIYVARARTLGDSTKQRRLTFVTAMAGLQTKEPYPPTYLMYAKGDNAEKMILVATQDGYFDTLYRMRALLATFTYAVRETPLFQQFKVDALFTFLDLLKLMGFTQLTLTDGRTYAHQIEIQ
jgi:hypothetical protein